MKFHDVRDTAPVSATKSSQSLAESDEEPRPQVALPNQGFSTRTFDSSEIRRAPVEVGSLSHYSQGFIMFFTSQVGFSRRNSINSSIVKTKH